MSDKEKQNRDLIVSLTCDARKAIYKAQESMLALVDGMKECGLTDKDLEVVMIHKNAGDMFDYVNDITSVYNVLVRRGIIKLL